jgi:hypothetical protein
MIKRQYDITRPSYFRNFYQAGQPRFDLVKGLEHYNATLGKSKNHNYKFNIKWHDPDMYLLFVMRWA